MTRLFAQATFVEFGPFALHTGSTPPVLQRVHGERPAVLKRELRDQCPRQPGVYGMVDEHGELIYVGKAKNLRARLMTYFRPRSRDPKAGGIVSQARCIVWEPCPDEFAALHRELELIRRWRPRCNVQGQPRSWQHTYVCLGRQPAPYAYLARQPPPRTLAKFGPIGAGRHARAAVRRLNDWFRLRDCTQAQEMVFAEQADLFPLDRGPGCMRHELGTCLGPCAAVCTRADYTSQVRAARSFLAGQDRTPLLTLDRAMREASAQQNFERAAVLRDKLQALTWLHRQLERMREADAMGVVIYPIEGHDGRLRWYILHAGHAVGAALTTGHLPCAAATNRLTALAETRSLRIRPAERIAGVMLLAAWFRKHGQERQKLLPLANSTPSTGV